MKVDKLVGYLPVEESVELLVKNLNYVISAKNINLYLIFLKRKRVQVGLIGVAKPV